MDVRDAAAEYRIEPVSDVGADEVSPRYKRTEVGVIPEDWCVCSLTQLADVLTGLTYRPTDVADAGVLVLRSSNIQNGRLTYDDNVYVAAAAVPPSVIVRNGDILVCVRNGSRELIGKSAMIREPGTATAFGAFMAVLRAPEPWFAYYTFQSACVERQIYEQLGATINQITGSGFKAFQVAYPVDRSERTAIAEALSDADALIESLQQLIAKQRAIKQGAMQALLTGRQRLPGFSGEWQTKRLGDVGTFRKGRGIPRSVANTGTLPAVRYGEIYTTHSDYVRSFATWISEAAATSATRIGWGDILFAGSGETKEEIGKCVAIVEDVTAYAGGDIVIFHPKEGDPIYFGYVLNVPEVNEQKARRGQGDAVVHISSGALAQIVISLPTVAEQTAIAAVLSDMDAAIDALEARLAKTRALKAGMMQQLLTGRIRLVPRGRAHA